METLALSARMAIDSKMASVRHVTPIPAPTVMNKRGTVPSAKKVTTRMNMEIACDAEKAAKIAGATLAA